MSNMKSSAEVGTHSAEVPSEAPRFTGIAPRTSALKSPGENPGLEVTCNLKVMVSTSDGASWNRKFYRMHRVKGAPRDVVVFKTRNLWSDDERFIYFVSDVPHLIKTTRNCWANSEAHRKTRSLWNGNPILWRHLSELIMDDRTRDIHLLHKIGYEHINLTSFSIMRVNLAAQ
ncbi:uncharacterized protein LOC102805032, partial [Saccoglossus kowalevskii]|uniref:Uncharacterized protein LOC102805032 n=1 Tax=Saccoglossus kowalevskii TaxID=10224 RepID=A0ABM0MWB9_SACKO